MEGDRGHQWVQERTGSRPCPFCGAVDWLPLGSVHGLVVVEVGESLDPSSHDDVDVAANDLTTISAVAYACKRCGFVRFHMSP
jgi:hypothetical protein